MIIILLEVKNTDPSQDVNSDRLRGVRPEWDDVNFNIHISLYIQTHMSVCLYVRIFYFFNYYITSTEEETGFQQNYKGM